jgi:hypothetical protein
MAFDVLGLGTVPNDGTGDDLLTAGGKINDNFAKAVEGAASSTADRVVLFNGTSGKLVKEASFGAADVMLLSGNQSVAGEKSFSDSAVFSDTVDFESTVVFEDEAVFEDAAKFETFINLKPGTAPGAPAEGDVYFDAIDKVLKCYADGQWIDLFTLPSP